jgi:hypothetical protein
LISALPGSAQDTANVRFVNLRVGTDSIDMSDQNGAPLATLGPFGFVSDPVAVDESITGLAYSIQTGSGFSASSTSSFDPIFTAGHDYLVVVIGDEEEDDMLVLDLTQAFGGADAVADDGLGRLVVLYYVRELSSGAFSITNADNTPLGIYFLGLDTSGFDLEPETLSLALLPGDYTLSATAANDMLGELIPEQSLNLAADEVTVVGVVGAYPGTVQGVIIAPDGVTILP